MDKERDGFPLTAIREVNILLSFHHASIVDVSEVCYCISAQPAACLGCSATLPLPKFNQPQTAAHTHQLTDLGAVSNSTSLRPNNV